MARTQRVISKDESAYAAGTTAEFPEISSTRHGIFCRQRPSAEHWRASVWEAQEFEHAIMGYLPGYATPRIVCDVPHVGKRWVLLIDDQDLIRAGLTMLCKAAPDLDVVGEGRSGAEALRLAADLRPDVILMDLRMPVMDGITATRLILQANALARIVALTTFDNDHLYPALAAGAFGFLTKDTAPAQRLNGIRRAAGGENPYSANVLERLVHRAVAAHTPSTTTDPAPQLTPREREVLALVGVTTVKTHIPRLMERTGAPNRVHLALLAIKHRIEP